MRRFVLLPLIVAFCFSILLGGIAMAQEIANPRMSDAPEGPSVPQFPSGTSVVYLVFDYANMQDEEVRTRVYNNVGDILFEETKKYTGSGTESVAISSPTGVFADGAYATNLYRGGYLNSTTLWQVGEAAPSVATPAPESLTPPPTTEPIAREKGLPLNLLAGGIILLLLLSVVVFWVARRALAAGKG